MIVKGRLEINCGAAKNPGRGISERASL